MTTWRTGRKVGRTIYLQAGDAPSDTDLLIGVMDTADLAAEAVAARNLVEVDHAAGAAYITLTGAPVARTVAYGTAVNVDVDAAGHAVGVEILTLRGPAP